MNIQTCREDLAAILDSVKPSGWRVTTDTFSETATGLIRVGHATTIAPQTFKTYIAEIAVTLWVNEADRKTGAESLYALLSPGADGIRDKFRDVMNVPGTGRTIRLAGPITTENVGPRDEGPTGFLAADIVIPVRVDA